MNNKGTDSKSLLLSDIKQQDHYTVWKNQNIEVMSCISRNLVELVPCFSKLKQLRLLIYRTFLNCKLPHIQFVSGSFVVKANHTVYGMPFTQVIWKHCKSNLPLSVRYMQSIRIFHCKYGEYSSTKFGNINPATTRTPRTTHIKNLENRKIIDLTVLI